jgi:hypothetical protein
MIVNVESSQSGEVLTPHRYDAMAGSGVALQLPPVRVARAALREQGFVIARDWLPGVMVATLADAAAAVAVRQAVYVTRSAEKNTLDPRVVTGELIKSQAPALFALYASWPFLSWIREVTGVADLTTSPFLRSSININCLTQPGQHYAWHTDAVPFTALLFLTTLRASAGGAFLIRSARSGSVIAIQPTRGELILMDGTRCEHAVAPLTRRVCRLTVPMVYPAESVARPRVLDQYRYDIRA